MEATALEWVTPVKAVMELARKAYSGSFLTIAVREGVGQNSPDAGARRCEVQIERLVDAGDDGAGVTRVLQIDDGRGMTPKVVQEAFLTFGGTFKPDAMASGGYGYAKFALVDGNAHVGGSSWELWTRPRGEEGVYHLSSGMLGIKPMEVLAPSAAPDFFPDGSGTAIATYRSEYLDISEAIRVLENTYRPGVRFYVNGEEIDPLYRATEKARLASGRLLFKKSCKGHQKGHLVVRVGGSYQFRRFVSARMDGVAILEIDNRFSPKDPEYPLTPAREQLRDRYRAELDEVLEGLQKTDNVKEEDPFSIVRYRGRRRRVETPRAVPVQATHEVVAAASRMSPDEALKALESLSERVASGESLREPRIEPATPPVLRPVDSPSLRRDREAEARLEWAEARAAAERIAGKVKGGTRTGVVDAGLAPVLSADDVDVPDMIVRRHRDVKAQLNPLAPRNVRTMAAWHAVLSEIMEVLDIDPDGFGVGWCLTLDSLAERFRDGGQEFFLLSPKGISRRDLGALTLTLVQRAAHEIVHRRTGWHDAEFVETLHSYLEQLNPHMRQLRRIVKAALRPTRGRDR